MSHKIDLKINTRYLFLIKDKKAHYIMSKGSILEEDITIVNIYAPNIGAPQYIRQTLTDIICVSIHGIASGVIVKSHTRSCDSFALMQTLVFQSHQGFSSDILIELFYWIKQVF